MTIKIDPYIASKAIYIDFEGNAGRIPTFLGVLYQDLTTCKKVLNRYVHEDVFRTAGDQSDRCQNSSMEEAFEFLLNIAETEDRMFFAWSTREKLAIQTFISDEGLKNRVLSRLFDCKTIAKRWKYRFHSDVEFVSTWGGKHRLSEYMKLVGYSVPRSAGPGNTGVRLKYVRNQLINRGQNYLDLTPTAKRKWKNVLSHNYHDCRGMREVIRKSIDGLGSSIYKNKVR